MFFKFVLSIIVLLSPKLLFCNGDEPEHSIEEYNEMLKKVNVTLNRMYKNMERRAQVDKDFLESQLEESMNELRLKEKETAPRRKRELVKLLENTYSFMKTGFDQAMKEDTYTGAYRKAKHAKDHAISSFKEMYSRYKPF
ncbi:uncharacterized protein LOC106670579 [Cimex lectularius]|uniref:Uncharacterized protein n=1 Tax=Cimex lectularius TaxID=79782 RepID=A0A8I6S636_CIMLE|nr:uncharacterized protein LOC106670579 [Cimex lectularius]